MKKLFLVLGTDKCHSSVQHILGSGKGTFTLFIEEGCPVSKIEYVLKGKEMLSDYKVSHLQTGMDYSLGGKIHSELLFSEIVTVPTDNALFILTEQNCMEFLPIVRQKIGLTKQNENHFTCEVNPKKFEALTNAYQVIS